MNLYSTVVFLHVLTAIFGLGPLIVLAAATSAPPEAAWPLERVAGLMRLAGWSLAGMFVTGAAIIALTHGALGETKWMRVSFGLFLGLGVLHGIARRKLRRAKESGGAAAGLKALLWTMCAVVAGITYLMEAKPW